MSKPIDKGMPAGGAIPTPKEDPKAALKKKQRQSIKDAFNPEDPIGNAIRSLAKKVRG